MSTVLIADDHAVVRAGYRQFLELDESITAVGEAASGSDALAKLRQKNWDLLLMDIHMPDRSGIDILSHVRLSYPSVKVLIMSGLPEEQYALNVLRAGAMGYLSKGGSPISRNRTPTAGRATRDCPLENSKYCENSPWGLISVASRGNSVSASKQSVPIAAGSSRKWPSEPTRSSQVTP